MQRSEMRTLIRDLSRVESHDTSDANLDTYLDEGYSEVVSNREWPWCFALDPEAVSLVADTDEYTLTSAVKRVNAVVEVTQKYSLTAFSQSDWARRKEAITSTSRPQAYVFTRGVLHLWPVPGVTDTLNVYYYEHPAFAAADASEPAFDSAFHTILADWALSRLWEQEEDFEKADDYRSRFEIKLVRMSKFYNTEMGDRPMIYGDRADSPTGIGSNMPWLGDAAAGGAV